MTVTVYSLLTALLVSSALALLLLFLSFQTRWIMELGLRPLCVLLFLAGLRLWIPLELPFARQVEVRVSQGEAFFRLPLWGAFSLGDGLAVLWLGGALFLLGRLTFSWTRHQRQVKTWERAPQEMMERFRAWFPQETGEIRVSRAIRAPYVSGFFRPVICLPQGDFPEEDLRLILLHERQHFRSGDQWLKLLFYGYCCLFWWNPVMWLLKRQLDKLLELRCDFKVLESLPEEERDGYYEMLLRTYRAMGQREAEQGGPGRKRLRLPGFYRHRVIQRFRLGLNFSSFERKGKGAGRAFALAALLFFAASYGVVLHPQQQKAVPSSEGAVVLEGGAVPAPGVSQLAYVPVSHKRESNDWLDYYALSQGDRLMVILGDQVMDFSTHEVLFTLPETVTGRGESRSSAVCMDREGNLVALFAREGEAAWVQRFTKEGTPQGEPVVLEGLDMGQPVTLGEPGEGIFLMVDRMEIWEDRLVIRSSQNTLQMFDEEGRLLYTRQGVMDFDVDGEGRLFFFTEEGNRTTLRRLDCETGREELAAGQPRLFFHLSVGEEAVYLMDGEGIRAFSLETGEDLGETMHLSQGLNGVNVARFTVMSNGSICILHGTAEGTGFVDTVYSPQ